MQIYKVNRKNVYAIRGDAYQPLYMCTFFLFVYTGTAGADPGEIGKNMIFWHEIPQNFSRFPPLGAIFFKCAPLT